MRFLVALAAMALIGCGSERVKPVPPTKNVSQQLINEMIRIEPQLLFCRGMVAPLEPHYLTGLPACGTGDGMLFSGLYLLSHPINTEEILESIRYSVDASGRPWRSPENIDYGEHINSFSRDMFKGLAFYLIYSKDIELAQRFYNYVRSNKYRMCKSDSDDRCQMTPATLELLGDVFEYLGLRRENDMQELGAVGELTVEQEAKINPMGYELHLVSLGIYIKALTGKLKHRHSAAARIIRDRQPQNLWYRFLANYTNSGVQEEYDAIAADLLQKMKKWPEEEKIDWIWQRQYSEVDYSKPTGHELVWLAKLLNDVEQF